MITIITALAISIVVAVVVVNDGDSYANKNNS